MTDRGQSEVIGFVLVFGLVVSTVAMASVVGFAVLQQAQAYERTGNAERAMLVLADNIDEVARDGVPSRRTEVDVHDAQLFRGDPITIAVTVTAVSDPDETARFEYTTHPVVYRGPDDGRLVYANGAVVRHDADGVAVLREPSLRLSSSRAVVPVIQTRSDTDWSRAGSGIQVRAEARGTSADFASTSRHNVTISIDSPRAVAWERMLAAEPDVSCARSGSVLACSVETDQVYLTSTRIVVTAN